MSDSDAFSMDFDAQRHLSFNCDYERPLLDPPVIRIYAAGPLTNNSDEVSRECAEVRSILKRVMGMYDFHGVRFQVYDPGDVTQPGSKHTCEEVYELNYEQSVAADLVIFHVSVPSLGVGCEAQIAADATVPRIILARDDVPVSRMFEGIFSRTITSIRYAHTADLELQLFRQVPVIAESAVQSARARRPILLAFSDLQLGQVIFKQRVVHNVSISELAERTDIRESWLRRLERNPVLASCYTAIQLNRIATVTNCYLKTVDSRNVTTLAPSADSLSQDERDSLDNLALYVCSKEEMPADDRVFRLWSTYRVEHGREAAEAVEYREGGSKVVTVDGWRQRDQHPRLF